MLRLISWNIRQGGGRRVAALLQALAERAPDVVALQELTAANVAAFREGLARQGLPHAADSFQLAPDLAMLCGPRRYGQLLASRWPLRPLAPTAFAIPWPERVLSAMLDSPWGAIELHTTHVPPGTSNGWVKIEILEGIFSRLACAAPRPRILCGDLNTPQAELPDGRVVTWAQTIGPDRVSMHRRFRGGSGARWDQAERAVLVRLAAHDLPDVYRLLHGAATQEYSWYWQGRRRVLGRRFDHIFAARALNPVSCAYLHALREQGLSDHAPIEVVFAPAAPS